MKKGGEEMKGTRICGEERGEEGSRFGRWRMERVEVGGGE